MRRIENAGDQVPGNVPFVSVQKVSGMEVIHRPPSTYNTKIRGDEGFPRIITSIEVEVCKIRFFGIAAWANKINTVINTLSRRHAGPTGDAMPRPSDSATPPSTGCPVNQTYQLTSPSAPEHPIHHSHFAKQTRIFLLFDFFVLAFTER